MFFCQNTNTPTNNVQRPRHVIPGSDQGSLINDDTNASDKNNAS